jgi:hypothetical protein
MYAQVARGFDQALKFSPSGLPRVHTAGEIQRE